MDRPIHPAHGQENDTISRLTILAQSCGSQTRHSPQLLSFNKTAKKLHEFQATNRILIASAAFDPLSDICLTIRQSGIDTTFASDFSSCCDALGKEKVNAVLLDAQLLNDPPNQEESDALSNPTTPVVLLCEKDRCHNRAYSLGFPPYHTVRHPLDPQALSEVLVHACSVGQLRAEVAEEVKKYEACRASLSPKVLFVLDSFIAGWTNRRIASNQDVSVRTVEHRRRRIYDAFKTDSAAVISYQAGLAACARAFLGEQPND